MFVLALSAQYDLGYHPHAPLAYIGRHDLALQGQWQKEDLSPSVIDEH